jgi:hypothetical protein
LKKVNEPRDKIQLALSSDLIKKLKIIAIQNKLTMRETTTRALTDWLHKMEF